MATDDDADDPRPDPLGETSAADGARRRAADDSRSRSGETGYGDLFSHAMARMRRAGARDHDLLAPRPPDAPSEDAQALEARRAFQMLHALAREAETGDAAAARSGPDADGRRPDDGAPMAGPTGGDRRFDREEAGEVRIVAEAMARQLGAAGQAVADDLRARYPDQPRLVQIMLLAQAGDIHSARRIAASAIVRAEPLLAETLARWMEEPDGDAAERQGLALAAVLDRRAVEADRPALARLATELLLVSLQAPLIRIVDLAPGRAAATAAGWAPALRERQATPTLVAALPHAPLSAEAIVRLRLASAGIAQLPFPEGRVSLAEPARRVAAALAQTLGRTRSPEHWDGRRVVVDGQIELALVGLGLMLAGVETPEGLRERRLVPAAHRLAWHCLGNVVAGFRIDRQREIDAIERRFAEEIRARKADLADRTPPLAVAERTLVNAGLTATAAPSAAAPLAVIVCPEIAARKTARIREVIAGHEHMLGEPVPLVPVGDLPAQRRQLLAEFPWAEDAIDAILGDLVGRATVRLRPVLLHGTPGSGKSHFARRVAAMFGLHLWTTDCGGADGGVFAGTDRRWSSTEPSHAFLAMSRGRQANPLILLDEIEKAGTRADQGRLWDAVLPFLDPGSNGAIEDRCLQAPIDASHVCYIATANRLDPLPWPLRDRFRLIPFPEPGPEHLDALILPLMAQFAAARGLDPRFIAPPDRRERTFLARHWRGGSVRHLTRLVEAVITARERGMSRH